MMKSEAQHFVVRAMEDTGAQFTDEQVQALAQMIIKITARVVEEVTTELRASSKKGKPPHFYAD